MQNPPGLLAERARQPGMCMAQAGHRDSAESVEIAFALGVPEPDAFSSRKGHGQANVSVHQMCGHKVPIPQIATIAAPPPS